MIDHPFESIKVNLLTNEIMVLDIIFTGLNEPILSGNNATYKINGLFIKISIQPSVNYIIV